MAKLVFIILALVLVQALAAPSEGDAVTSSEGDSKKVEKATVDKKAEDRNVLVADDTWNTWLSSSTWNIATAGLAVAFILGGAGLFYYYYVTTAVLDTNAANYQGQANYYQQGQGTQPAWNAYQNFAQGRALDTSPGSPWNFTKVLEYIEIAQKAYEGFDWQNLDCQKRILCELSQKDTFGTFETGRAITNNYILKYVDLLDGIPIPQMIQAYLIEYKEAISQGKNSTKECGLVYSKCKFSIKEVIASAGKRKY